MARSESWKIWGLGKNALSGTYGEDGENKRKLRDVIGGKGVWEGLAAGTGRVPRESGVLKVGGSRGRSRGSSASKR